MIFGFQTFGMSWGETLPLTYCCCVNLWKQKKMHLLQVLMTLDQLFKREFTAVYIHTHTCLGPIRWVLWFLLTITKILYANLSLEQLEIEKLHGALTGCDRRHANCVVICEKFLCGLSKLPDCVIQCFPPHLCESYRGSHTNSKVQVGVK